MRCRFVQLIPPSKLRANARAVLTPVLLEAGHRVAAEWRQSIPHQWPASEKRAAQAQHTADTITVRQVSQVTVAIGTASVSGRSLEEGAVAHAIRSKGGGKKRGSRGLVAWPAERGGSGPPDAWRVRKVAHHPGVKPRLYGDRALNNQRSATMAKLIAALATVP